MEIHIDLWWVHTNFGFTTTPSHYEKEGTHAIHSHIIGFPPFMRSSILVCSLQHAIINHVLGLVDDNLHEERYIYNFMQSPREISQRIIHIEASNVPHKLGFQ